jgi:AcrR family transcriptional regulator
MKAQSKRQPLTRERILRAALSLIDREGLAAISMRRIGEELGVEAMSLYNHVDSKAAILDGIYEAVLQELPPPRRAAPWPQALRERARALRAVLRAHPHALPLFVTRPAVTPAAIAHVEGVLELLHKAGFSAGQALMVLQTLLAYVVGHSLWSFAPTQDDERSLPDYEKLSTDAYPRVRELGRVLPTHNMDKEFEFGLDAMVGGLEAQRARAA